MKLVLPGDEIDAPMCPMGAGIWQQEGRFIAIQYGFLQTEPVAAIIHPTQKRYIPVEQDTVLGIVTERYAENYKLDINSYQDAYLPSLAFENVTKRNKPNLALGALVYARVHVAHVDMETELSCVGEKVEGLGELSGGMMISCSRYLVAQLLNPGHVLRALGEKLPFEIAIGSNGRVWVKAASVERISFILEMIRQSETLTIKAMKKHIKMLWEQLEL
jgi:exosome complex component RRP40